MAGLFVPGLGYALVRRVGLAAGTMLASVGIALLALRIVPTPLGVAGWRPALGTYLALCIASAAHAATLAYRRHRQL